MFVLSICVYPELERLKQKVGVEHGQWGKVGGNLGGMVGGGPEEGRGQLQVPR